MKLKSAFLGAALTAATLFAAGAASAAEFEVKWSGASFGNSATGVGFFNIDTSVLPDVGFQAIHSLPDPAFQILSVTISGASSGNGTFGESDFGSYYFATPSALDYTQQLVGQSLTNGYTYGSPGSGETGDFNLFGTSASAPYGSWYFTLTTNQGGGDQLAVTSIAPVPELSTWAMLLVGFAGLGFAGYRRKIAALAA